MFRSIFASLLSFAAVTALLTGIANAQAGKLVTIHLKNMTDLPAQVTHRHGSLLSGYSLGPRTSKTISSAIGGDIKLANQIQISYGPVTHNNQEFVITGSQPRSFGRSMPPATLPPRTPASTSPQTGSAWQPAFIGQQPGFATTPGFPTQPQTGFTTQPRFPTQPGFTQPQPRFPTQPGFTQPQPRFPTQPGFTQPQPRFIKQPGFTQPGFTSQPRRPSGNMPRGFGRAADIGSGIMNLLDRLP